MIERQKLSLRVNGPQQLNLLVDAISASIAPAVERTTGAHQVDQLTLAAPSTYNTQIIAISFTALLGMSGVFPLFGALGKIVCGLDPEGQPDVFGSSSPIPSVGNGCKLPADASLLTDLWNPENDPLPPITGSGAPLLPVAGTLNPSQPVPITQDNVQLCAGVYMLPSVLGVAQPISLTGLFLTSVYYVVYYNMGTQAAP